MTIQELEQCISLYGKDIYAFCLHLTCNRQEADDLYQDTFLTVTEQLYKVQRAGNPKSYLLSIAFHIWKNRKRKAAWRQRIVPITEADNEQIEAASTTSDTLDSIISSEEKEIVQQAVHRLADKYRIPVILYYTEHMSVKEISQILFLPAGTVKSRLHHARKQLKEELEVYFS